MAKIFVYLVELPDRVNEAVLECADGYTVYIDPRLSYDGRRRAYQHALKHIENKDFEKENVQQIEEAAHREEE